MARKSGRRKDVFSSLGVSPEQEAALRRRAPPLSERQWLEIQLLIARDALADSFPLEPIQFVPPIVGREERKPRRLILIDNFSGVEKLR